MVGQFFPSIIEALEYLDDRSANGGLWEGRRRQRLVADHQVIHRGRQNEPCIPFLPGHDQRAWFIKLANNGIWDKVFEYLTEPADVTSAYFACEMFREHLEEKRKMMFLPKMLGILRDKSLLRYPGFGENFPPENEEESREILEQRLVSKGWKKSFEQEFLEPQNFFKPDWYLQEPMEWHPEANHPMLCQFDDMNSIDLATEAMETNNGSCASLVRVVWVNDAKVKDTDLFYSKLIKFFDLRGAEVWGFRLSHKCQTKRGLNYDELVKLMSSMVHLKALRLGVDNSGCDLEVFSSTLMHLILQHPFPSISSLEYCHFSGNPSTFQCLVGEILSRNGNIKAIDLGKWSEDGLTIPGFIWNALSTLRLEHLKFVYATATDDFIDDFVRLRQFDWPLKVINICNHNGGNRGGYIEACEIFSVLSTFKNTLVDVDVCTNKVRVPGGEDSIVIDFPHLKRINFLPVRKVLGLVK